MFLPYLTESMEFHVESKSETLLGKCPNTGLFLVCTFSFWYEYGDLLSKFSYSLKIRKYQDQKKLRIQIFILLLFNTWLQDFIWSIYSPTCTEWGSIYVGTSIVLFNIYGIFNFLCTCVVRSSRSLYRVAVLKKIVKFMKKYPSWRPF